MIKPRIETPVYHSVPKAQKSETRVCVVAGSRGVLPIELMQCIVNEPPPRLQHGPADLADFISRCLQTEAERRPLPEQLCRHPLVTTNMRNSPVFNLDVVAKWIKSRL